jgi:glycerophosphoryl diester phosphodiesterase
MTVKVCAALPGVLAMICAASATIRAVEPLENAHAHNDYWHTRPLNDAIDHGFTSIEADVFLVDGKLLVGHEPSELQLERTLESLYLAPLARHIQANRGGLHKRDRQFLLLVDVKSDAEKTYTQLQKELSKYADLLTVSENGRVRPGAVTVIISGNRPRIDNTSADRLFAGLDGRISDLKSYTPSHVMPMISDNWRSHFLWNGEGPMPRSERAKLNDIVRKAHAADRLVRFWGTPENELVWQELRSAEVDLIGTDQLERLSRFLRSNDGNLANGAASRSAESGWRNIVHGLTGSDFTARPKKVQHLCR